MYLTDVDDDSAPMEFVLGSHRVGSLRGPQFRAADMGLDEDVVIERFGPSARGRSRDRPARRSSPTRVGCTGALHRVDATGCSWWCPSRPVRSRATCTDVARCRCATTTLPACSTSRGDRCGCSRRAPPTPVRGPRTGRGAPGLRSCEFRFWNRFARVREVLEPSEMAVEQPVVQPPVPEQPVAEQPVAEPRAEIARVGDVQVEPQRDGYSVTIRLNASPPDADWVKLFEHPPVLLLLPPARRPTISDATIEIIVRNEEQMNASVRYVELAAPRARRGSSW